MEDASKLSNKNTVVEYQQLLNILQSQNKADVYEKLLKTEENVLAIANRVANTNQESVLADTVFYNQSLSEIIHSTTTTWKNMFQELFVFKEVQSVYDVMNILVSDERKIYFGIFIALVAMFLFFIDISS